jgi:hypothetical protein
MQSGSVQIRPGHDAGASVHWLPVKAGAHGGACRVEEFFQPSTSTGVWLCDAVCHLSGWCRQASGRSQNMLPTNAACVAFSAPRCSVAGMPAIHVLTINHMQRTAAAHTTCWRPTYGGGI